MMVVLDVKQKQNSKGRSVNLRRARRKFSQFSKKTSVSLQSKNLPTSWKMTTFWCKNLNMDLKNHNVKK